MAVPGYGRPHAYNYVALTFWTCEKGPIDISKMWDDPIKFFAQELGKSKPEVQKFIKQRYNDAGVSVMLSAFGAAEYPTTLGLDPVICAQKLGDYVRDNNFDGVDIDYEDNKAMDKGTGEQWLILFMKHLRKLLPYHIITHAPQGPYFTRGYIAGGYRKVHKEVGHLIDFYNVQFYNQMSTTYETYESLFKNSGTISPETSIMEMRNFGGVSFDMLVIGKPASKDDVYNSGYVRPSELLEILMKGNREVGWSTGVMFWQFHSDQDGTVIN
jgi:chitinase